MKVKHKANAAVPLSDVTGYMCHFKLKFSAALYVSERIEQRAVQSLSHRRDKCRPVHTFITFPAARRTSVVW